MHFQNCWHQPWKIPTVCQFYIMKSKPHFRSPRLPGKKRPKIQRLVSWVTAAAPVCVRAWCIMNPHRHNAAVLQAKMRRVDSQSDYMNTKPRAPRKKRGVQNPVPRYFWLLHLTICTAAPPVVFPCKHRGVCSSLPWTEHYWVRFCCLFIFVSVVFCVYTAKVAVPLTVVSQYLN